MIRWESIIGSKMRPAARTSEMVAIERKKEYNRKREATPERIAGTALTDKPKRGRPRKARIKDLEPAKPTVEIEPVIPRSFKVNADFGRGENVHRTFSVEIPVTITFGEPKVTEVK